MHEDAITRYALSFLGVPYKWGGNTRFEGMDCSGFVCEVLRAAGILDGDYSAETLYRLFESRGYPKQTVPLPRSIAFYGLIGAPMRHISFCLDNRFCVEAGGGKRTHDTKEKAMADGAMIRIRPIKARKDFLFSMMPNYRGVSVGFMGAKREV